MKNLLWTIVFFALTNLSASFFQKNHSGVNKLIYSIEIHGTHCGFSEVTLENSDSNEILSQKVRINLRALGTPFENKLELIYRIDESGRITQHTSKIDQSDTRPTRKIDNSNQWTDEWKKNQDYFEEHKSGGVPALEIDSANPFFLIYSQE